MIKNMISTSERRIYEDLDRKMKNESLMKDLYFLGKVLDKKYRLLRIAYTIFMIGIVLTVIAFVIAFEMMQSAGLY